MISDQMLDEQLKLEEEMITLGSNRFFERNNALVAEGALSRTKGGNEIASGGIQRVADRLAQWLKEQYDSGGRRANIYDLVNRLDLKVTAYLGLRVTLDQMSTTPTYQRVAIKIGTAIEEEMKFRAMESKAPGLYTWCLKRAKKASSEKYKKTIFNIASNRTAEWIDWPEDTKLRLGVLVVECIRRACGIIDIGKLPDQKNRSMLYIMPNKGTMAWLRAHDFEAHLLCPVKLPCLIPPRHWTDPYNGGYYSQKMPKTNLVKTSNAEYLEELKLANPTTVYDGVNALQDTAWSVNTAVLDVVNAVWHGDSCVAGLPAADDPVQPTKPADIETNEQARREYRRKAAAVWEKTIPIRSQRIQTAQILSIAKRFKGRPIYYPYQLDFRGRIYPQPGGLQPQGCDLAKGLLQFHKGLPLDTPESIRWFYIHGANCFGVDKVSFSDRLSWVLKHDADIRRVAADPVANQWWSEAKDYPIQFLAWCLEYAHHDEPGFLSHLPVALDASCSGLQHFSAMLRDPVGAASVNLLPSSQPLDVYKDVAVATTRLLQSAIDNPELLVPVKDGKVLCQWTKGEVAKMWLAYGINRDITKRPVMTVPYGSTRRACKQFVMAAVSKQGGHPFGEQLPEACEFLASTVWVAIGEVVIAARHAMGWLQKAARIATSKGLPVSWVAPSGFPVLQAYPDMTDREVKTVMDKVRIRLLLQSATDKLDKRRQANGVSPNFVHSCDAAALVAAVAQSKAQGIDDFACVHDSFGTHAHNTQRFVEAIKATFVAQYEEHDVLAEFKQELEGLGVEIPDLPPRGTLEIRDVLKSPYCFA